MIEMIFPVLLAVRVTRAARTKRKMKKLTSLRFDMTKTNKLQRINEISKLNRDYSFLKIVISKNINLSSILKKEKLHELNSIQNLERKRRNNTLKNKSLYKKRVRK